MKEQFHGRHGRLHRRHPWRACNLAISLQPNPEAVAANSGGKTSTNPVDGEGE
jgi:hypothetical protein